MAVVRGPEGGDVCPAGAVVAPFVTTHLGLAVAVGGPENVSIVLGLACGVWGLSVSPVASPRPRLSGIAASWCGVVGAFFGQRRFVLGPEIAVVSRFCGIFFVGQPRAVFGGGFVDEVVSCPRGALRRGGGGPVVLGATGVTARQR